MTLISFASATSEDYDRLMKAFSKEATSVKDDYCYACLRAAALVGVNLSGNVRKSLEKLSDQDWYPYLGVAYDDLVCLISVPSVPTSASLRGILSYALGPTFDRYY